MSARADLRRQVKQKLESRPGLLAVCLRGAIDLRYACAMNFLDTTDPEIAVAELEAAASELLDDLDRVIPSALRGHEGAAREYVRAWRGLSARCLTLAHDAVPDLVVRTNAGEVFLIDVKHARSSIGGSLLDQLALSAPFSQWVTRFGAGRGAALCLVGRLRDAIPGLSPIPAGPGGLPHWDVGPAAFARFARQVWVELQEQQPLLQRIESVFGLSRTELAGLFEVRRQAVSQWIDDGIPSARRPKALVVAQIADLLERNLLQDRIPAAVRTPARAYGNRSMLDMIADDRHERLLELVRDSFDWATSA